jgi:hypothetical protein
MIYILNNDHLDTSMRRSFKQQEVLYECIMNNLKSTNLTAYKEIVLDKRAAKISPDNNSNQLLTQETLSKYSFLTFNALDAPWNSIDDLQASFEEGPASKAKAKFTKVAELLCANEAFAAYDFNMSMIVQVVITKVLFVLDNAKTSRRTRKPVGDSALTGNISPNCSSSEASIEIKPEPLHLHISSSPEAVPKKTFRKFIDLDKIIAGGIHHNHPPAAPSARLSIDRSHIVPQEDVLDLGADGDIDSDSSASLSDIEEERDDEEAYERSQHKVAKFMRESSASSSCSATWQNASGATTSSTQSSAFSPPPFNAFNQSWRPAAPPVRSSSQSSNDFDDLDVADMTLSMFDR